MISYMTKFWRSFQAGSFRALSRVYLLIVIGAALAFAAVNLWAWHHYREAGRLVEQYRFSQAYAHYTRSLQVWRWSAALHFRAGRTARRAGLYPQAEQHLAQCQQLQGGADASVPLALEHLLLQAQSGDINAVEETLWKYVEKNKEETPLILESLARGYVRVLRPGTAMRCLRKLLERQPDNVEALVMAGGIITQGGGDAEEAIKDYRRALELDAERDDARLSLAQILLRDRADEARWHFECLLARQPNNREAMLGLGQAQRILGESDKARGCLETVLANEPGNSKVLTELGILALTDDRAAESEALFRKAIAADPANRTAHRWLYQCLAHQPGREDEVADQVALYERVEADLVRLGQIASKEMTRSPNDPKLHYELGTLYLRYGKPEVGVRWLYSALKLEPSHQPSHQALYDYFRQAGELDKAEQHRVQLRSSTAKQAPAPP